MNLAQVGENVAPEGEAAAAAELDAEIGEGEMPRAIGGGLEPGAVGAFPLFPPGRGENLPAGDDLRRQGHAEAIEAKQRGADGFDQFQLVRLRFQPGPIGPGGGDECGIGQPAHGGDFVPVHAVDAGVEQLVGGLQGPRLESGQGQRHGVAPEKLLDFGMAGLVGQVPVHVQLRAGRRMEGQFVAKAQMVGPLVLPHGPDGVPSAGEERFFDAADVGRVDEEIDVGHGPGAGLRVGLLGEGRALQQEEFDPEFPHAAQHGQAEVEKLLGAQPRFPQAGLEERAPGDFLRQPPQPDGDEGNEAEVIGRQLFRRPGAVAAPGGESRGKRDEGGLEEEFLARIGPAIAFGRPFLFGTGGGAKGQKWVSHGARTLP